MASNGICRHKFVTLFRSVGPKCAYLDRVRQCSWCGCTVSVRTYQRDAQAQGWTIKPVRTRKRSRPIRETAPKQAEPVLGQTGTGLMGGFMLNNEVNRKARMRPSARVTIRRK